MEIRYSKIFIKHYAQRIQSNKTLVLRFKERVLLFIANSHDSLLRDHSLRGRKTSLRAFSITGDIRVIYQRDRAGITLLDIGSHNQVY